MKENVLKEYWWRRTADVLYGAPKLKKCVTAGNFRKIVPAFYENTSSHSTPVK